MPGAVGSTLTYGCFDSRQATSSATLPATPFFYHIPLPGLPGEAEKLLGLHQIAAARSVEGSSRATAKGLWGRELAEGFVLRPRLPVNEI